MPGYHKNGECRPPNPFTLRVLLALKTLTVVLLFDFRLADEFNRVQRGHQNFLESSDSYAIMTLIGGLKHPIACAVGSVCYCVGSVLYMKGYSDNKLDVKMARYKKGAGEIVVHCVSLRWHGLRTYLTHAWHLYRNQMDWILR